MHNIIFVNSFIHNINNGPTFSTRKTKIKIIEKKEPNLAIETYKTSFILSSVTSLFLLSVLIIDLRSASNG